MLCRKLYWRALAGLSALLLVISVWPITYCAAIPIHHNQQSWSSISTPIPQQIPSTPTNYNINNNKNNNNNINENSDDNFNVAQNNNQFLLNNSKHLSTSSRIMSPTTIFMNSNNPRKFNHPVNNENVNKQMINSNNELDFNNNKRTSEQELEQQQKQQQQQQQQHQQQNLPYLNTKTNADILHKEVAADEIKEQGNDNKQQQQLKSINSNNITNSTELFEYLPEEITNIYRKYSSTHLLNMVEKQVILPRTNTVEGLSSSSTSSSSSPSSLLPVATDADSTTPSSSLLLLSSSTAFSVRSRYPRHQQQQQQQQSSSIASMIRSTTNNKTSKIQKRNYNLDRNERSTNLSHIMGTTRKIQLHIKNRVIQILPDGTVNGTQDTKSDFTILQRGTVDIGQIKLQGVATCLFLCMDACGHIYGTKEFNEDCIFNETMQENYNIYSSSFHSTSQKTFYLALNKMGRPRKTHIPANKELGKLAKYAKSLTYTVPEITSNNLLTRIFGKNHIKHGLKQLCDGMKTNVYTAERMKNRPKCVNSQKNHHSHHHTSNSNSNSNSNANNNNNNNNNNNKNISSPLIKNNKFSNLKCRDGNCIRKNKFNLKGTTIIPGGGGGAGGGGGGGGANRKHHHHNQHQKNQNRKNHNGKQQQHHHPKKKNTPPPPRPPPLSTASSTMSSLGASPALAAAAATSPSSFFDSIVTPTIEFKNNEEDFENLKNIISTETNTDEDDEKEEETTTIATMNASDQEEVV